MKILDLSDEELLAQLEILERAYQSEVERGERIKARLRASLDELRTLAGGSPRHGADEPIITPPPIVIFHRGDPA